MRNFQKISLSVLGGLAVIYCVAAQVFVVSNPDLRLRAVLADPSVDGPGVIIQAAPLPEDCAGAYPPPERGDRLVEVHDTPIRNFAEFAQSMVKLRRARLAPGGKLYPGADPSELNSQSTLALAEIDDQRYARIKFFKPGETEASLCWVRLQSMPTTGLMLTFIWLVPQLLIFSFGAMAYWSRPADRPSRAFFVLSFVTLVAFVGGAHWWVVAGSLWLTVPFAICAVLLPAVLLNLFLVYPSPKSFVVLWSRWTHVGIYALPVFLAALLSSQIIGATVLSGTGDWVLADGWDDTLGTVAGWLLSAARFTISVSVLVAAVYFLLTTAALVHGYRSARNDRERRQMSWVLTAGLIALIPVSYSLYLAYFRRVELALGSVQVPMILASVCFMLAFMVGMMRPRLTALGGVMGRGMLYYIVSAVLAGAYALLIAAGSVIALKREVSLLDEMVAVTLVLMLTIIVLSWLRDRVQRVIDRRFFHEKYQLDKALGRMNQAVIGLWDRETLADQMLDSCSDVLGVTRAACYFRDPDDEEFVCLSMRGTPPFADRIVASRVLLGALRNSQSLQRIRAGTSATQAILRTHEAELIHGLEVENHIVGLIVLGQKPNATAFTAEDVSFLTAFERVAGFAIHFAKVHDDFGRLTSDLREKRERIDEQDRQIDLLERQLNYQRGSDVEPSDEEFQVREMIGRSPAILEVLQMVRKVAASESSVLVRGESGTGKELLARAIHENSPRREGPLVSLQCAALSPTLLESELFGHVRGAFTDAHDDKIGRFQLADGGTLFLDEIGDISADVQIKLLRVLQQRSFEPVGSNKTVQVDVRVVTATHRNLEELIATGQFREDLYYRLNVISVTLPPLRERKGDVLELAMHFLARASQRAGKSITQIDESAHRLLTNHTWPGNVRELENVIERAVVLAEGHRITVNDLPQEVQSPSRRPQHVIEAKPIVGQARTMDSDGWTPGEVSRRTSGTPEERQQLIQALERADGNKARAARLLGLPRSTLCSKLKKHALD